jgi:quercetin dioxygenase-like cupin family protein
MLKSLMTGAALVLAVAAFATTWTPTPASGAAAPTVVRKVLNQVDLPNNQTMAEISVEIPVGGREGRHTHPGALMVYVTDGAITLDYEGKPTATYKAGDAFFVEAGKIHEGINNGTVPSKAIATFSGPKGPLTVQLP